MINKRLINMVGGGKKYIAANVAAQWVSLAANITMMTAVTSFSAGLLAGTPLGQEGAADGPGLAITAAIMAGTAAIRAICSQVSAKMGYLSSKTVKKTMREKIYGKMLKLGASYNTKVRTSEVVQVAVEGAEQLETYFGAYLPQFFYAMAAPLTLFIYISTINLPSAVVLLVCVPLIPSAIAAVQTWAKRLLSRYWDQYTALGETFLENLQGLTTLKIYRSDGYKNDRMNEEAEKFRKITMKVSYVDIVKLLEQLLEEQYPAFAEKGLSYELRTNVKSLEITADGNLLARLFDNLIGNAIKYGADGKRVIVKINAGPHTVEVKVINYGYIIPEKDQPLIFNKFYRVDRSRSTNTGGTGLGLAIAKDIAEMHSGSISVQSDLNGTVFTVRLKRHFNKNNENFVRA